jgi:acetate kinase
MPARVLVFNSGSNSLKFQIIRADPTHRDHVGGTVEVRGVVEPVNAKGTLSFFEDQKVVRREEVYVRDHTGAVREIVARINTANIDLVGHRVVHGADRHTEPTPIDDALLKSIEELEELAPLHNAGALAVMPRGTTAQHASSRGVRHSISSNDSGPGAPLPDSLGPDAAV